MPPIELQGHNLGERHKHFNKLVKDAIANENPLNIDEPNINQSDVSNLINIDVANANQNVEYIIKTLTCSDMLYVTRALKKCDWLICDEQYAHIINPEYLNANLYPKMQTKAVIKLKRLIQLKLQNEQRAEQFYNYETKSTDAIKWLPKCSIKFIENNFTKHVDEINISHLKRLCEKSIIFLEKYVESASYVRTETFEKTLFLLHVNVEKYLDILESQPSYSYPNFGKRATKVLMMKCPKRIIDKFNNYCNYIDTPTFVKYLNQEDLQTFLVKKVVSEEKENEIIRYFSKLKNWSTFLSAMPKSKRIEFINQVFINDVSKNHESELNDLEKAIKLIRDAQFRTPLYHWYQFLTFELAFSNIKSMIGPETETADKNKMLEALLISAKGNLEHGKCLLQYFRDKHINSTTETRITFLVNFILHFNTHSLDKDSWKILEDIIDSLNIYNNITLNNTIIQSLIVYKTLHNQKVPEEALKLINFNSLKFFQSKLDSKEKETIFNFLQEIIWKKVQNIEINEDADFERCIHLLNTTLMLLKDWNKNILDYPFVLEKIKQLVKIKKEKVWNVNMSSLYNLQKSWRKYMFDESIILSPTEDACINSLKHRPNLLDIYKNEVESMFFNNDVSLRRLLRKVRIYWSESINREWKIIHLNHLNHSVGQNAITRGLCILLPKVELTSILEKYAPKNPKVDWDNIQELELGFQRCFAKNMHNARPHPPLETVLLYAKGDYLQYALCSVLAVYYNMSPVQCEQSVFEILNTPVSLQKHGLRLLFNKLSSEKLRETCNALWTNTKNSTIRTEIFKISYELLCNEKDEINIIQAWELLEMFIDNLTFLENKAIYKLLYNIDKIPESVQGKFLVKSYNFLKTLINNNQEEYDETEWDIQNLAMNCRKVIDCIPSEFITDIIAEFVKNVFFQEKTTTYDTTKLISSYLLYSNTEETQMKKYDEVLAPILVKSLKLWNDQKNSEYYIKINIEQLLFDLIYDFKHFTVEKNMIVPVKMFTTIQSTLEKSLLLPENYVLIRTWQLATNMVTLFDKKQPITWEDTCSEIAPEFGKICKEYLREDTKTCFPRIYLLFMRAFESFSTVFSENIKYEIFKSFVENEDFVAGYLAALQLTKLLDNVEIIKDLREKIRKHPSVEVKMHYYNMYQEDRAALFASA